MSRTKPWEKIEQARRLDFAIALAMLDGCAVGPNLEYSLQLEWARRVIECEEAVAQQGKKA